MSTSPEGVEKPLKQEYALTDQFPQNTLPPRGDLASALSLMWKFVLYCGWKLE